MLPQQALAGPGLFVVHPQASARETDAHTAVDCFCRVQERLGRVFVGVLVHAHRETRPTDGLACLGLHDRRRRADLAERPGTSKLPEGADIAVGRQDGMDIRPGAFFLVATGRGEGVMEHGFGPPGFRDRGLAGDFGDEGAALRRVGEGVGGREAQDIGEYGCHAGKVELDAEG